MEEMRNSQEILLKTAENYQKYIHELEHTIKNKEEESQDLLQRKKRVFITIAIIKS